MSIKLYDAKFSFNCRKVRVFAAELGVALESLYPDVMKGELRTPDYLAKNPNSKIPTIVDEDGFTLWESAAILRYLAAKHPQRGFLPTDARQAALLDQWMFWWTAHLQPAIWSLYVEKRIKVFLKQPANDPGVIRAAEGDLKRFLPVLEGLLKGKEYPLGTLSLFDFMAAPELEAATQVGVELAAYPGITEWMGRMASRAYWKEV